MIRPDCVPEMMFKDFGTRYLITDPRSDVYMKKDKKKRKPFDNKSSD